MGLYKHCAKSQDVYWALYILLTLHYGTPVFEAFSTAYYVWYPKLTLQFIEYMYIPRNDTPNYSPE